MPETPDDGLPGLPGAQPPPTSAELVSETIAIARDILAVLASPGTA